MAAGSIVVDLLLKTGSFETDSARASKSIKQFQKDAEAAGKAIGVAFTGAVVGLAAIVKSSVDSADHLNDLSKKTGIAADTLGGIGFAAQQAGGDLESVALGAGKLNKSLAEAAAGNKEAGEAFKLLGINVKDATGQTKSADVALAELADKFASYADGPEKTALALRIFGKAGADMIPLLDDGGAALLANIEYFKRYSGVTVETAQKADQFNDTQEKIKLLSKAFGNQLAAETLPLMQVLADRFLAAKEQGDGFKSGADGIVSVLKGLVIAGAYVADTFRGIGREIGALAAQGSVLSDAMADTSLLEKTSPVLLMKRIADAFKSAQFKGISDAVKADGEQAKKQLDAFVADVSGAGAKDGQAAFSDARFDATRQPKKKPAPRLAPTGVTDTAAQELKKRLDGELKLIQDAERAQADAYAVGNTYLDGVYQDGLVSQKDFFSAQKNLRDAGLQNTLDAIDKEIAAQKAFIANPVSSKTDRVGAEEKIKLAVQQRAEAVTKASASDILANQADARAAQQLADSYANLKVQVLSASGDEFGAAQIRNAQQFREAQKLINQAGGDPRVADQLKRALDAQSAFTKAQTESSRVSDELSIAEQRIALAQQTGAIGEIEALGKVGDARKAAVAQMESMVAAEEAIARASGNPALILNAEKSRLELDKLKASLDPLKDKFDEVFKQAGSTAIEDFINGTKSAKDALRGFGKEIFQSLAKTTAQDLSGQIFGPNGVFGGAGGVIADLFGKRKDPVQIQTAAVETSLANLAATGIDPTTAALARLQQAADGAAGSFGKAANEQDVPGLGAPSYDFTKPSTSSDGKTGEQSIIDLFKATDEAQAGANRSAADFSKSAGAAAIDVARLAQAAGSGSSALAQLPSIINSILSASTAASAGGGGGGGIWGTLFSAAASYFTGGSTGLSVDTSGYSANAGVGYSNAAGISGGRADGGPVMPGQTYLVGERGPEKLVMGNQSGNVVPNASGPSQTFHISIAPPADMTRKTAKQLALEAGQSVRRATARLE